MLEKAGMRRVAIAGIAVLVLVLSQSGVFDIASSVGARHAVPTSLKMAWGVLDPLGVGPLGTACRAPIPAAGACPRRSSDHGRGRVFVPIATAQQATPFRSADAAAELTALFAGPGVVFRAPENCVNDHADPYDDPATLAFCAVKDVVGALGGPSSGAAPTDFVAAPNRFEFDQPLDCGAVGAVADGRHDNCAVVTGAATLLRDGLPVRLFGVCGKALPKDCAVLGTITDATWKPDGVYLLMDPARVTIHCQYAQDADRNGCNENGAYTAGQTRPLCSDDATNPMCQYGAEDTEQMLAAYTAYCTHDAETCLENQLAAQWGVDSVVAIGSMNRGDQEWDCEGSRAKAERFARALNTTWSTNVPIVQVFIDVARNQVRFGDATTRCEPLPA